MKKSLFKKFKKDKELQKELVRAHLIIALLAAGFASFVLLSLNYEVEVNSPLSIAIIVLLGFVALFSLGIVYFIKRK